MNICKKHKVKHLYIYVPVTQSPHQIRSATTAEQHQKVYIFAYMYIYAYTYISKYIHMHVCAHTYACKCIHTRKSNRA